MSKLLDGFRKGKNNIKDIYNGFKVIKDEKAIRQHVKELYCFIYNEIEKEISSGNDDNLRLLFLYGCRFQCRKICKELHIIE